MVVEDVEKSKDSNETISDARHDDYNIAIIVNPPKQGMAYEEAPKSSALSSQYSSEGGDYEELGPVSIAALPSDERNNGLATRIDPVTGEVIKVKWKRKKRKGLRHQRLTPSVQDEVVEEENEDFDDRMGDAEDRVMDIQCILETGKDVDTADYGYTSNVVTVKKKKKPFVHFMTCGVFQKKERVIGY